MKWEPREYHTRALDAVLAYPKYALWLEMGLGKTAVAATAVRIFLDHAQVNRVLVVAPTRVCKYVWSGEIRKWDHLNDLPCRYITGTRQQRQNMLDTPWHGIELVSYENLKWLVTEGVKRGHALPWQMLILDESSKMKAAGTQRFRALRRRIVEIPRVLELTGSPAPQGLLNLWAPAFLLDQGQRLGETFPAFRERWFESDYMGWKFNPRPGADREIHRRLDDVTLSMRAKDYLDLPDLVVNDIPAEMPTECWPRYRELESEMFLRLAEGTVEVANAGVLTGKCRQFAQGFLYTNGTNTQWGLLHDAKLRALADVVEEAEGQNVIVAYAFKADLARLRKAYPTARTLEECGGQDGWNTGKYPMLLIHPASAGHGLNLQDGARIIVMYGCPWSFDQYEQVIARIAGGLRRERTTFVHRIFVPGTVDVEVLQSADTHQTLQDLLKDAMARRRRP